jgi:phage-related minor tail protein
MSTDDNGLTETNGQALALKQTLDDLDSRSRSFGTALGSALASATTGGRGLDSVLQSLGVRLSNIALSAGLKPLETALGNAATSLTSGIGNMLGFAKGGVPGGVTAFADGGVVASPTFFPMGGDIGLMGEAGSEAILPLKRGADGTLGVATPGSSGGSSIVFNITTPDAASFQKSQAQISAMLARTAMRGQRNL